MVWQDRARGPRGALLQRGAHPHGRRGGRSAARPDDGQAAAGRRSRWLQLSVGAHGGAQVAHPGATRHAPVAAARRQQPGATAAGTHGHRVGECLRDRKRRDAAGCHRHADRQQGPPPLCRDGPGRFVPHHGRADWAASTSATWATRPTAGPSSSGRREAI